MNRSKIGVAAVAAALLMGTFSGCSAGGWAARSGDIEVSSGVYVTKVIEGYREAEELRDDDLLEPYEQQIEGQDGNEFIINYAKTEVERIIAIRKLCAEKNITLDEETVSSYRQYIELLFESSRAYYIANGIEQDDLEAAGNASMLRQELFLSYYGEGGEREVPKEELAKEFTETYLRSRVMMFPKVNTLTGEELDEETLAESQQSAEEYYQRALAGESFTDLIYELETAQTAEGEEPPEKEEDDAYDLLVKRGDTSVPSAYLEALESAEPNAIVKAEDNTYIYVIQALDINGVAEENRESYYNTILSEQKDDEFNALLDETSGGMEIEFNQRVIDKYAPKRLVLPY